MVVDSSDPKLSGEVYAGSTYTVPAGGDTYMYVDVGYNGSGTITHNIGTLTVSTNYSLVLGYNTNGNGAYNLSGTGNLSSGAIFIGEDGTGTFTQSGGSVVTNVDPLYIGDDPSGVGTYALSGTSSSLSTGADYVGVNGTGTFTQSGGTFTTNGNLIHVGLTSTANGTYNLNGGTLTTSGVVGGSGASTFNFNGGTLQASVNNVALVSGITTVNVRNGGAIIDTNGLSVSMGQSLTHSAINGDNATDGGLTKNGAGTLTLSAVNTYTGGTTISAGTLTLNGTGAGTSVTILNAGFEAPVQTAGGFTYYNSSMASSTSWTFNGLAGIAANGSPWYISPAPQGTQAGYLQQTGSATQTVTVNSLGVYTLSFAAEGRYGTNPNNNMPYGADDFTATIDGTTVVSVPANLSTSAFQTFSGSLLLTPGSHTITFSGVNSVGGDRSSALDNVSLVANLGPLPTTTAVNLTTAGATLNNTANQTIGSLTGVAGTSVINSGVLATGNTSSTTFAGVISGNGYFIKQGSGTQTLSGANTYTGSTIINAGTLLASNAAANGSATGTGSVTVNNAGTLLGGTGFVAGPVTVNSGAGVLGGNGTAASGALTLQSALTLGSGSIIELALGGGGTHSTLARSGTGTWSFATNQAFTFLNYGATPGFYDNIITGLSADPGGEANWTITNAGFRGVFAYDGSGDIDLTLVSVPEPATWLAGLLCLGTLGYGLHLRCRAQPACKQNYRCAGKR